MAISGWWLLPSLQGGITSINQDAVSAAATYYSPLISLNPLLRLRNPEILYLGLGYVILAIISCYQWRSRSIFAKAAIILGFLIFLLTTPFVKPLYENLPLHNLLWPDRFVPLGIACMLLGTVEVINLQGLLTKRNNGGK